MDKLTTKASKNLCRGSIELGVRQEGNATHIGCRPRLRGSSAELSTAFGV